MSPRDSIPPQAEADYEKVRNVRLFAGFVFAYAVVVFVLSRTGADQFKYLHLVLDTANGILSLLLAMFLVAEQHKIAPNVRIYLAIGFGFAAATEILHALVAIEWNGWMAWASTYAHRLRPATWPPSAYVLPLALGWTFCLIRRKSALRPVQFGAGMALMTLLLFALSLNLPTYIDTGILGIQRPTQVPLLVLLVGVVAMYWRERATHPLFEGIALMCVLLFVSDLCMLYSTSPHEKFTMMAHAGKLFAYTLLHAIQMRVAAHDSRARSRAEAALLHEKEQLRHALDELRIAAVAFESQNGIVITDAAGVIVRVNPAFTRITGYSAEDAVGQTMALLKSGRHDQLFYQRMWDLLKEKGYWQGEIWNRRKNGNVYAATLTVTVIGTLERGITQYVGSFSDITKEKESEAEIHRLAYYDPLTGLPNRRLLQDRLDQALASSLRSGQYGAMLFIDLDHFKTLNDTRGHDVGDLLLVEVARRLTATLRAVDTVARQGGDEFVVLLKDINTGAKEAAAAATFVGEKLRAAIDKPFLLKDYEYHCKISVGIGLFRGTDTVEDLFKHADLALYHAKNAGRNTLCFFDPAMQAGLELRNALEMALRQALSRNQLRLYYQPQVDAEQRVIGAEALMRWQHPDRGLVQPNDFIPIAEDTGLILPMGYWALETACAQLKAWQADALTSLLQVAVNVSARQFRQADFVAQVKMALDASGANPARLKLELTESMVLGDVVNSVEKMRSIKRLGVKFAMDDFGTGYSSLSYLAQLPLDQLKIDQSFVRKLPGTSSDETVARTIITLAQGLSMDVIAEGVETEAQRDFLAAHGCHAYQGYLFSRPLPLDAFEEFVRRVGVVS